jgi:hypothetical protein
VGNYEKPALGNIEIVHSIGTRARRSRQGHLTDVTECHQTSSPSTTWKGLEQQSNGQ